MYRSLDPLDGYRPCVGLFLLNSDRHVFIGRRINQADPAWQFPQGGIDRGESPTMAGLREMKEEIGTDRASVLKVSGYWHTYDLPKKVAAKLWRGRFRGQCQKWLALAFEGSDQEIDLNLGDPEFSDWQWAHPQDAIEQAVPFKKEIYASVVDEFRSLWA